MVGNLKLRNLEYSCTQTGRTIVRLDELTCPGSAARMRAADARQASQSVLAADQRKGRMNHLGKLISNILIAVPTKLSDLWEVN